jgi:hypothetical protein
MNSSLPVVRPCPSRTAATQTAYSPSHRPCPMLCVHGWPKYKCTPRRSAAPPAAAITAASSSPASASSGRQPLENLDPCHAASASASYRARSITAVHTPSLRYRFRYSHARATSTTLSPLSPSVHRTVVSGIPCSVFAAAASPRTVLAAFARPPPQRAGPTRAATTSAAARAAAAVTTAAAASAAASGRAGACLPPGAMVTERAERPSICLPIWLAGRLAAGWLAAVWPR